ncbi:c-type cytochrome [Ramlibacter montanisoli]|uniref:C-type cytochrome n=1 Tax=Ramlibacter montanisoli TaxID=2732512 RepID=A0A849KH85_9BURK|nr:c-type cytochrome [Ramlibacter montanisoli]NNU44001.1 c-type cytochrome [Ramlibacter montanisoli]
MNRRPPSIFSRTLLLAVLAATGATLASCGGGGGGGGVNTALLQAQGRQIFRFDTFGDEIFWTDTLRMHEVIEQQVSPTLALTVGLKVDSEALPASVANGIRNGTVDLTSPATTVALIKLDAVVGIKGRVETINGVDRLTRVGVTCALCHSTVDNSFSSGIGKRLDGWANRDLDPGLIISLSPALSTTQKAIYASWGKGMYDPRFNIDGLSKPAVIPPAFGLQDVHKITFTGDGDDIAYWNRYVAVTQMGGQGTFTEPRLGINITNGTQDLVSSRLPALQAYQLSLAAPAPPAGSFDATASARGKALFEGKARCSTCHTGSTFTDANLRLHPKTDSMVEPEVPSHADRSATKLYRTTPLRGLWQHAPYFHDGSAATTEQVVTVYNTKMLLGLTPQEILDVAQYLRSL